MFLDEELKEIYETNLLIIDSAQTEETKHNFREVLSSQLLNACVERYMPADPQNITDQELREFPFKLKQTDNSWKLFVKKHDTRHFYKEEGFRNYVYSCYLPDNEDRAKRLFTHLGWALPDSKKK